MQMIDKTQTDEIIDELLGNNDLTASPEVWYGLHQIKNLPVTEIIDVLEGLPTIQSEAKVEFHDKDHVWIDGKQYISLRRFQEAVKEAQPKEGHWIEGGIYRDVIECNCSECGQLMTTVATVRMNYCPRCGARMKEGESNG